MYVGRGAALPSSVFHPQFQILIPQLDGRTGRVSNVNWLKPDPAHRSDPKAIESRRTFNLSVLDITGKVAVCKVEALREGHLEYTDYVTFTKIEREWKVVAKVFHHHLASS
jgi:hypothetical protein